MDSLNIEGKYRKNAEVVLYQGDCLEFLKTVPGGSVRLIVTSPPYNIGKSYEKKTSLERYIEFQEKVIAECVRVLSIDGNICWQVGNYVHHGEIVPLDIPLYPVFRKFNLKMRNRIIWHFEHGLHCSKRFSGRYESINWFTKDDEYIFKLDGVRVPQKYPNKKYFKGPKAGQLSCNPLGKNPGDVWIIPNVKHNHIEKTSHPCQFPVELVERLVLSMTQPRDWVLDPFMGVGSTAVAAIRRNRRVMGAELLPHYIGIAKRRILDTVNGSYKTRPMNRTVYNPKGPQSNSISFREHSHDYGVADMPLFANITSKAKEPIGA